LIDLLEACLRIPSLSGQERAVAEFLCAEMARRGFARAFIDEAGNAVGIVGHGPRQIVLLGHMDTVGGEVPVRYEDGKLYGRGSVDAKGPLCAFILAAESVAPALSGDWQIVVIGAVEEECATSRGARFVAGRYRPAMCVIGEPSGSDGITLGYKGRLLIHARAEHEARHTAIPAPNAAEQVVTLWNHVRALADRWNADRPKAFDQLLPSLRRIQSGEDGLREWCEATIGVRLPLDYGPEAMQAELARWGADRPEVALHFSGGRAGLARAQGHAAGPRLGGRHPRPRRATEVQIQDRHGRFQRGRAGVGLSDRRLWAGGLGARPHATRARGD
jgi:LysW-gamma-L-lysine carboxypeptidase